MVRVKTYETTSWFVKVMQSLYSLCSLFSGHGVTECLSVYRICKTIYQNKQLVSQVIVCRGLVLVLE